MPQFPWIDNKILNKWITKILFQEGGWKFLSLV